jgi:peptidoglycan/LPS O-acetylase OafA/YrhL
VYLATHRAWALPYVGHFWSLAVEEQFYLVWPIIVLWFSRRTLVGICVAVTILAFAVRCGLSSADAAGVAQIVLTPCRFDALCVGGFLALSVRSVGLERVARTARRLVGPMLGLVLLASAWNALRGSFSDVVLPLRGTLVAMTFGALLVTSLAAKTESACSRLLQSRLMCFFGTRSYGLYVFHGIIAYAMWEQHGALEAMATHLGSGAAMILEPAAGVGVSILVAAASYELFEKPFLRLKNRLAPSSGARDRGDSILYARAAQ